MRIRGIVIDHGLSFAPAVLTQLVALGGPRREYSQRDIEIMLKVDEAVRSAHGTAADAATAIQTVPGFEHVDRRHLARWKLCMKDIEEGKPGGLRGRKVDRIFEALVMSKLVVMIAASPVGERAQQSVVGVDEDLFDPLDPNDNDEHDRSSTVMSEQQPERCVVKENIAYSFALVMRAGRLVQKQSPADDVKIQGLKFSSRWVQGFLRRNLFKRHRVVTDAKAWPSITGELMCLVVFCLPVLFRPLLIRPIILHAETTRCLNVIQDTQVIHNIPRQRVVYFDESAITALGAEYQQVLPGQGRASNVLGAADGKERITTGIFSDGDGNVPPSFNIIRCTSKKADMRKVKVISELHKLSGFTAEDGWELREWCHDVLIKGKDGLIKLVKCARPYLIHKEGTVITCQSKAWMDQICLMMMGN